MARAGATRAQARGVTDLAIGSPLNVRQAEMLVRISILTVALALPVCAQITFDGVVTLPSEEYFAIADRESGKAAWVHIGESFERLKVIRFLKSKETLVVEDEKGVHELHLSSIGLKDATRGGDLPRSGAIIPDESGWEDAEKLAMRGEDHFEKIMISYDLHIQSLKQRMEKLDIIRAKIAADGTTFSLEKDLQAAEESVQDEQRRMFWFRSLVAKQVRDRRNAQK